jgi:hypothetical protein
MTTVGATCSCVATATAGSFARAAVGTTLYPKGVAAGRWLRAPRGRGADGAGRAGAALHAPRASARGGRLEWADWHTSSGEQWELQRACVMVKREV